MDVKLFSLCKQEVPESEAGKKCIFECVKSFFPDCQAFSAFTSQKRMLLAISQSLRAADIVIVAVQNNMYNATKRLLSAALDLKTAKSRAIETELTPLLAEGKIKQSTFDANIRFPVGAEILPTSNNLNSGFALSSGGQHIIYLPIEAPGAEDVVLGSLYDYLATIRDDERAQSAFELRHSSILSRTAKKLDEDSVKVAFSGKSILEHIKKYSQGINTKASFIFEEVNEHSASTNVSLKTKVAKLCDTNHSQIGVVVSDIGEKGDESFIKAAILADNGMNAITFYAEKNESDEDLISNCIDKIMLMLYNYESLSDCIDEADKVTKSDKALRRRLFSLTAGAIGLTAIISLIIALILQ